MGKSPQKKSSEKGRRKGSRHTESQPTVVRSACQHCLSKAYITKCTCYESPTFKGTGTDSRPRVSTQDTAGMVHNTHLKSPVNSPEHEKALGSRISRLNLLDHLMNTDINPKLDQREYKHQSDKFVRTTPANARNQTNAPGSMNTGQHKSKLKSRPRFTSEEIEHNHFEKNLRFNQLKTGQVFQNTNPLRL